MNYIVYNPQSFEGNSKKGALKLYKKLTKLDPKSTYLLTFSEIENKETSFVNQLNEIDTLYICGGDGALDYFINRTMDASAKCKIYYNSTGSNSDFRRDFNSNLINIKDFQGKWPKLTINGTEKYLFANCCGMGVDAAVCRSKLQYAMSGNKRSYFSIAYNAIKAFRLFSIDIEIDGINKHYDDVFFFDFNNGRYFGGGMKIAPNAKRDGDSLYFVIVHGVSKRKMLALFPLVYLGIHSVFKKNVEFIECKRATIKPDGCMLLQRDGETLDYVKEIDVSK